MKKYNILIISILFAISPAVFSQYFVKSAKDSVFISNDSVKLWAEPGNENFIWQISQDSIHWEDFSLRGDTLKMKIFGPCALRKVSYQNECSVAYSDTFTILPATRKVNDFSILTDSIPKIYIFPNGFELGITQRNNIPFNIILDSVTISELNSFDTCGCYFSDKRVVRGFVLTDDSPFSESFYNIKLPVNGLIKTDLPVLYKYFPDSDSYSQVMADFVLGKQHQFIQINSISSGKYILTIIENGLAYLPGPVNFKSGKTNPEEKDTVPCEEKKIHVKSIELDYSSYNTTGETSNCHALTNNLEVSFLECEGQPTQKSYFREISSDCKPRMTAQIEKQVIKENETVMLNVFIGVGNVPLKGQHIVFGQMGGIQIDPLKDYFTDSQGRAEFRVTATSKDTETKLIILSDYSYFLRIEFAEADGEQFYNESGKVEGEVGKTIDLFTYDMCTRPGLLDCNKYDKNQCEYVKSQLINELSMNEVEILVENESYKIDYQIFNYQGENISGLHKTNWSSSNPYIATVQDGLVQAAEFPGMTTITANVCKTEVSCIVLVKEDVKEGIFVDLRDGQEYNWKKYGDQVWMVENMNYGGMQPSGCFSGFGMPCYDSSRMYFIEQAIYVCPVGWHLPTDVEWMELERYMGMPEDEIIIGCYDLYDPINCFSRGDSHNTGDVFKYEGFCDNVDIRFFSPRSLNTILTNDYVREFLKDNPHLYRYDQWKKYPCYVRCVRDD